MPKMKAPDSGVKIRMYKQGHGDCFLLCFKDKNGEPFYMLIDCGLKNGSKLNHDIDKIVADISASTENHLNLVLITHEHEDHVNGFWRGKTKFPFEGFTIDKLWLAWTENPDDETAKDLREKYNDTLISLTEISTYLSKSSDPERKIKSQKIDEFMALDLDPNLSLSERKIRISGIRNKTAIKKIKEIANTTEYLYPFKKTYQLTDVDDVRVFAMGPPEDEVLLKSLDPEHHEAYKHLRSLDGTDKSFTLAFSSKIKMLASKSQFENNEFPFDKKYQLTRLSGLKGGEKAVIQSYKNKTKENDWRRIDNDWLDTAGSLALRIRNEVNNTSLVIAIELLGTGKTLLFTGDAQRGNWISWSKDVWNVDNEEITAKDILAKTVFYKVGHHGSHNATLKGTANSEYANLNWMAKEEYKDQFVAMIPAHSKWANSKKQWKHPLKSIEAALKRKAKGRVFITDKKPPKPSSTLSPELANEFTANSKSSSMYFEYTIQDE